MKIILCLDERRGILFGGRRQSKDREVIADIIRNLEGKLYIAPYSERLFEEKEVDYVCTSRLLEEAGEQDTCFLENTDFLSCLPKISQITVYWWNRHYPSDLRLETDLTELGFHSASVFEFAGFSHDKITKETFQR